MQLEADTAIEEGSMTTKLDLSTATPAQLTEELQCSGCVIGGDTTCGKYRKGQHGQCASHAMGTMMTGAGLFALGFPKGFCRPGLVIDGESPYGPVWTVKLRTWNVAGVTLEASPGENYGLGGDGARFNVPIARTTWNDKPVVLVHSPRTNRLTALFFDKPLSTEDENAVSGTIRLADDVLDPDGPTDERSVGVDYKRPFHVRFWTGGEKPTYVERDTRATWALEREGLLFVRVCRPATAELWVDVVTGGRREEIAPSAVNVGEFISELD